MSPAAVTLRVARYQLRDVARSRWLLAYAGFFLLATDALLRFSDTGPKALLSLVNVVLLVVPLVGLVFGTAYLYAAREFTELLLAQPVGRRQLFAGLYLGLALPLAGAFAAGVALPVALRGLGDPAARGILAAMLLTGVALTLAFTALAFVVAVRTEDRVRGLALAIGIWLALAVLYDGLMLFVATRFAAFPVERPLLALVLANPVDLGRIVLLLELDISALMGYTGAVFRDFFGTGVGTAVAGGALALWVAGPVALGLRSFRRRDF